MINKPFTQAWTEAYKRYSEDAAIELGKDPNAVVGSDAYDATAWIRDPRSGAYIPSGEDYLTTLSRQIKVPVQSFPQDFRAAVASAVKKFSPVNPDVIVMTPDAKIQQTFNTKFPGFFIQAVVQVKDEQGNPLGTWGSFKPQTSDAFVLKRLDQMREAGVFSALGNAANGLVNGVSAVVGGVGKNLGKIGGAVTDKVVGAINGPTASVPQAVQPTQPTQAPDVEDSQERVVAVYKTMQQIAQASTQPEVTPPQPSAPAPTTPPVTAPLAPLAHQQQSTESFAALYGLARVNEAFANAKAGADAVKAFVASVGRRQPGQWTPQDYKKFTVLVADKNVQSALKKVNKALALPSAEEIGAVSASVAASTKQGARAQGIQTSKDPHVVANAYSTLLQALAKDNDTKTAALNLYKANQQSTDLTTWSIASLQSLDNLAKVYAPDQAVNAQMVTGSKKTNATLSGKPPAAAAPTTPEQLAAAPAPAATAPVDTTAVKKAVVAKMFPSTGRVPNNATGQAVLTAISSTLAAMQGKQG